MKHLAILFTACVLATAVLAQRGPGMGRGMGSGMQHGTGMGPGGMGMGGMDGMGMMGGMGCGDSCPGPVFMSLLSQHSKVQRQYKDTDAGIESLTTSSDPQVAALIKTHVQQMRALLESCAKGQCSHTPRYFDPLFRAVYSNADKVNMQITNTDQGVRVVETGSTDVARQLVQAHAAVVSQFVKKGFSEHHKTHDLPPALKQSLN